MLLRLKSNKAARAAAPADETTTLAQTETLRGGHCDGGGVAAAPESSTPGPAGHAAVRVI